MNAPAHAGRLHPLDRCIFMVVFALMIGFAAVVPFTATTSRGHLLLAGPSSATGQRPVVAELSKPQAVQSGAVAAGGTPRTHAKTRHDGAAHALLPSPPASAPLDAQLASALGPVLGGDTGQLAVGVVDLSTGASATYDAAGSFRAAGIAEADILAALLLQHQQRGTPVSDHEAELAADMIENGSDSATSALWNVVGGASGIRTANAALKLSNTAPLAGGDWTLTRTTVADQLQLLADLAGTASPLSPAARDYALGLMADASAGQRWGVAAAASRGTTGAVDNGSLIGRGWVVNSIGVVQRHGHMLLVVVLSTQNAVWASAVSAAQAAAVAAANVVG